MRLVRLAGRIPGTALFSSAEVALERPWPTLALPPAFPAYRGFPGLASSVPGGSPESGTAVWLLTDMPGDPAKVHTCGHGADRHDLKGSRGHRAGG
jgi:hypothetical protein